jgi:anaerobic selenocysteine-containing dehydrogenase
VRRANGDLPGFRNWENDEHVADLARVWNVEPSAIPHYAPSTHAMQIFRYAEQGSVKMLWICGTNPAVSLPELGRIRAILGREGLFTVVQDLFPTETAQWADVVLPAATWGEKTGCFTNADRTVHLSDKAVDPPGQARPDLDIFLDSQSLGRELFDHGVGPAHLPQGLRMACGDQVEQRLVLRGLGALPEHLPVEGVAGGGQVQVAQFVQESSV